MILPLQAADGKFVARCSLLGSPDQGILGVVDSGATATGVDAPTCKRAGPKFAGDSDRVRCVHRNHREVVRPCFGHIDTCGKTGHTRAFGPDMGPESEITGINAILGRNVLQDLKVTLDEPGGTGTIGRPAAQWLECAPRMCGLRGPARSCRAAEPGE